MTARINISVPDGLKARMDALGSAVNWSRVACSAFESRLTELDTRLLLGRRDEVQGAMGQSADGALEALCRIVAETRPDLVPTVEEDIGPLLDRMLDQDTLRQEMRDRNIAVPRSVTNDPEGLGTVIGDALAGYHRTVIRSLEAKLVFEIILLRLSQIKASNEMRQP